MYNHTVHISIDNLLQIISFCSGFGALIVLAYLAIKTGNKKAVPALNMLVCHTVNYLIGITFSLNLSAPLPSAISELLTIIQLLSVFLFLYFSMLFIECLGEKPQKMWHRTGLVLLGVLLLLEAALYLSSFTSSALSYMVTITAMVCAVFLWLYLLKTKPSGELAEKIRTTGLAGYILIIPANALEKMIGESLGIHPAGAFSFLFLTMGVLYFSIAYLLSGMGSSSAGRLELQVKYGLTNREMEVMGLLRRDCSYKEISSRLGISMPTVKTHVSRVYRKTGTGSGSELKYRFRNLIID